MILTETRLPLQLSSYCEPKPEQTLIVWSQGNTLLFQHELKSTDVWNGLAHYFSVWTFANFLNLFLKVSFMCTVCPVHPTPLLQRHLSTSWLYNFYKFTESSCCSHMCMDVGSSTEAWDDTCQNTNFKIFEISKYLVH